MRLTAKTKKVQVVEIKKKTEAHGLGEINRGDILQFEINVLERTTNYGRGSFAQYPTMHNITQGTKFSTKSQSELTTYFTRNFKIKEL